MQVKPMATAPVELQEKAARPPKTANPPSPRLRRASWRPPLLAVKQTHSPGMLAPEVEWRSDRLVLASFALVRQPPIPSHD